MMKGWKWIAAAMIVLSVLLIALNQSNNTPEQSVVNQNYESIDASEQFESPKESKLTTTEKKPLEEKELSVAELSELSKQYIVQCKDPFSQYGEKISEDQHLEVEEVFEKWSESDVFEQQFALALANSRASIARNNNSKKDSLLNSKTLSDLANDYPNSTIANYFLVSSCLTSNDCDNATFQNATEQDPYNGALWKLIATQHAAQGKVEETLAALKKQITAANYKTYWGDTTHLYEQALLQIGMADFLPRQIMAIGFSAALAIPSVQPIFNFCRQYTQPRADIAEACLKFGEKQFQEGDNLLEQSLGLSLQKLVYQQLGNFDKAKELERDKRAFGKAMGYLAMSHNLTVVDSELNKYWWENILLYGETKALELTFTEAVRLSSDPDYNPCPNGKVEPRTASE